MSIVVSATIEVIPLRRSEPEIIIAFIAYKSFYQIIVLIKKTETKTIIRPTMLYIVITSFKKTNPTSIVKKGPILFIIETLSGPQYLTPIIIKNEGNTVEKIANRRG